MATNEDAGGSTIQLLNTRGLSLGFDLPWGAGAARSGTGK